MELGQVQEALRKMGVDARHIRRIEVTTNHSSKRMVVIVSTFASNTEGKRFTVFDAEAEKEVVATEQHVVSLDDFVAALAELQVPV